MKIEMIRIKCIKDFYMEDESKVYTKGQKYVFVNNGNSYIGFDDEWNSPHWMDYEDLKGYFDLENIEKINIIDFVLGRNQ